MKAKVVKNGNVNVEPLKVNEYIEQQKQKALLRQEVREELIPIIRNELAQEVRKEVEIQVRLEYDQKLANILTPKDKGRLNSFQYIDLVLSVVALELGVTVTDMKGRSRKDMLPDARHVYCYLMKLANDNMTIQRTSLEVIGRVINLDHSTVIHGARKVKNIMETDKAFRCLVEQIIKSINDKLHESK